MQPDLSHAQLNGAKLDGADFSGTNLRWATLAGAMLNRAEFSNADLTGIDLSGARLTQSRFVGTDLHDSNLGGAILREANLHGAYLRGASAIGADLCGANLSDAYLAGTNLRSAKFEGANLKNADLSGATMVCARLVNANLTGCRVYGLSAWDVDLEGAIQSNLIVTPSGAPEITVDNLEVAQFIYLILNNQRIRQVIDTITSKVVLILGRFTPNRKPLLDAIREGLRKHNYLPVLFDFEKPSSRSTLETVSTLAHLARFVIADLTDARSVLQELQSIVPANPSVPVQTILLSSQCEPGMFDYFRRMPWVLAPYSYATPEQLMSSLESHVIAPAEGAITTRAGNREYGR